MAKFKYIGDPNDDFGGPRMATIHGHTFVKGEVSDDFPEKTDDEKALVEKLQGHSHLVDMSDKEASAAVADREKAKEAAEKARAKAEEEQRKKDEADLKQMQDNQAKQLKKQGAAKTAATAPRPPGKVTREPVTSAFGGRTVEQRTRAEDHTKAGKTKGGGTVEPDAGASTLGEE